MLANHEDLLRELVEEKEYRKSKIKISQEDMVKALIEKRMFTINGGRYYAHSSGVDIFTDVQMPDGNIECSNCYDTWEAVGIEQIDYYYKKVIGV